MSARFDKPPGPYGSEFIDGANDFVTDAAVAHTLGAWAEFDASVSRDAMGLWIQTGTIIGVSATNTSMILELGFGAASSEVMQVQFFVGAVETNRPTYLPLHVPKGTRVSGRIQGAVLSDIYAPKGFWEFAPNAPAWGGFMSATAIGLNAATSAPTTGDLTDNAWDEAIASTTEPYRALTLHPGVLGTSSSSVQFILDVGVGGAGAEQLLGSGYCRTTTTESSSPVAATYIAADIPTGSRLSIRKNNTAPLTGHLIGWR